jgi:TrkA domain protein
MKPNDVEEHELPGIGRRYDLRDAEGAAVSVIVHHTGRRDIYTQARRDPDEQDMVASFNDDQARKLGAILGGAYFKPAVVTEIEAVVGGLVIDWVTLRGDSPAVGQTIADLEIRRRTRITVMAVLRDDEHPLIAPEPTEELRADDRLVVVGRPEDMAGFVRQLVT